MKAHTILPAALAAVALLRVAPPVPAQKPPAATAQTLADQCRREALLPTAQDCARWAARKVALTQTACPDKSAPKACRSFQELLRSNDAGLLNGLAHEDHLYVCFASTGDEFFTVSYSEPAAIAFSEPSPEQAQQGVPQSALAASGASDFASFRNGVRDSDASFHDPGNWVYLPPAQADLDTMRQNADFRQAQFKGKLIQIANDEWKLVESFRNESDSMTRHTVTVQLATGRFRQEFAAGDSGKVLGENSGRCLIAPSAN